MMVFEQDERKSDYCGNVRGRTQIIADILHQCKENKRKSHVMQKANLNFDQVNHYLGDLQSKGLVEPSASKDSRTYRTTDRGREFLDRYQKLIEMFKGYRSYKNAKSDRANINLVKPIHHEVRSKTLAISFLLTIGLSMVISQCMPLTMTTTINALSIGQEQLAYAQEDNISTDNGSELREEDVIVNTGDEKETEDIGDGNGREKEDESNDGSKFDDDSNFDGGNESQSEAREQEQDGAEGPEKTDTVLNGNTSSVEQPIASIINREPPDDDCLFDPSLPKCAPIDGECPDGFAMNEDGQCYPNKPCPKGYERRDNDETGTCYSVAEKHLKIIVNIKGAYGAGKISVESKGGAGDSKFVDNIQGTHTFKFYKNSMPVGAEFEACAYSDQFDKELCANGKNGPENEPERVTISFSDLGPGLKVMVTVKGTNGAGKVSVTSGETGKSLSREVHNIKETHTFNFKAGEVPVGKAFEACAHSDKLGKELCTTGRNGPENAPEKVTISLKTKSESGLKVIVKVSTVNGPGKIDVTSEETDRTLSKTVGNLNGKHTFNFKAREVPVGGAFEVCAYSEKLNIEQCAKGKNGPENEPEEVGIILRNPLPK
jgi:predicted transcriptional regulator